MLTQYMWEKFKMTGRVSDYLVYVEEKQAQKPLEGQKPEKLPEAL